MWFFNLKWGIRFAVIITAMGIAQEDSLKTAISVVDRRQRDLSKNLYYGQEDAGGYYQQESNDNVAFLKPENNPATDRKALYRSLLDYLKDDQKFNEFINQEGIIKKRFSSSFRERIAEDEEKQKENLAEFLFRKLEHSAGMDEDDEYLYLIQKLHERYRNANPNTLDNFPRFSSDEIKKRLFPTEYYTSLGYDSVGMKKRNQYYELEEPEDSYNIIKHTPKDENFDKVQDEGIDELDTLGDYYGSNNNQQLTKIMKIDKSHIRPLSFKKKYMIAKRNSDVLHGDKILNHHKRTSIRRPRNLPPTDPKIAKELNAVFGLAKIGPMQSDKITLKETNLKQTDNGSSQDNFEEKQKYDNDKVSPNKEVVPDLESDDDLQIEKKSIDWSDYFGYDRKKKSFDNIDNEWLMERYQNAVAVSKKNNPQHPSESVRHHGGTKSDRTSKLSEKTNKIISDEEKLKAMDTKLKNIEDSIIDDTLKYTGAHEGTTDIKEIFGVKNKVVSRLATAYNLEKMRQTLNQYKQNIDKQKQHFKNTEKFADSSLSAAKRVSVPRKQAIDEERERILDGDNNIKCSHVNEDCQEQNYKTPSDIAEEQTPWKTGDCPKVEKLCSEMEDILGNYGRLLEPACNIHQTCLLCGDNSWFAPTRKCNLLFIRKSEELCDGDAECQEIANHSVRYFLDINRILRAEPIEDCDLHCPDGM